MMQALSSHPLEVLQDFRFAIFRLDQQLPSHESQITALTMPIAANPAANVSRAALWEGLGAGWVNSWAPRNAEQAAHTTTPVTRQLMQSSGPAAASVGPADSVWKGTRWSLSLWPIWHEARRCDK